ncbi:hypothetical protein [endosymbiont of Riftia pachyptila]|uniref:DUF1585 domain-containing protein n=1 Tax=endosymbiont of Riftia pachyptila (vent Ph05) TaxID=1048808 RepID=G2DH31_9GAMM|nr:hypothetical protein Rifp1Sym_ef00090 [endosymbiont of Riftia pachyptila (vent Ph05)]
MNRILDLMGGWRPAIADLLLGGMLIGLILSPPFLQAGVKEQARRIHDRLAGVPPQASVLAQMETQISANNDPLAAAYLAMEHPAFYDVTLKNFAAPWTNEEQSLFVPLNDYSATVIGMVRDEVPFNQLLSADLLYQGDPALGLPPYSPANNDHYEALETSGVPLKDALVAAPQSDLNGLPATATAGVITSRQAARAFFIAGTNRAMFRFTLLNHLCLDLEQVKDTSRAADRVRQDIPRSPGGDSRLFLNNCVGCHAGMDPLVQAYAYYDYDEAAGRLLYTPDQVRPKYLINADNFKPGYVTPDDQWDNYWRAGPNALLGWDSALPGSGNGAKSLGVELANSQAFASCQAKKVFKAVCLREPVDSADHAQIAAMSDSFRANNYSLKRLFAESAVYCRGE